ncbi:MAG: lipid-A-disaccharide synthase [Pseudorhodoplanes sp.]
MKIFLVAAEESGDRLGAALMQALRAQRPQVSFAGVGGSDMAAAGMPSLFAVHDLSIVGLAAIPRRLPMIFRRIRQTAEAVLDTKPDVLVIIDSPDFTHRVARRVRRANPAIPIVDYVSPSVWAWRPGRARAMRAYVDHLLALLPFEPDVHARLGGPPCTYVGHPLVEQAQYLRPDPDEARRRMASPATLLVLPGSRGSELRRLQAIFARATHLLAQRAGPFDIVIPSVPHLAPAIAAHADAWPVPPRILTDPREKQAAFRTARAALAKSGTVTLELAVAGVPMVTAYRLSAVEAMIARQVIRVSTAILANLVLGENVVPEFLQRDCQPEQLAAALAPLLSDSAARRRQIEAFARLDGLMQIGTARPAQRAAGIVIRVAEGRPAD